MDRPVIFPLPKIAQKKMPVLTPSQVQKVIRSCKKLRDHALILFMVDTGARRAEVVAMNWGDIDIGSGIALIQKGKGGKARSVVVGVKTRRSLLKYRRTVENGNGAPIFQSSLGGRLKYTGMQSALLRIGKRAGMHLSPHILRRTFATLCLRSGMNLLYLQGLLGHSSLEMTKRYTQMMETDLVEAHRMHGPVDHL